MADSGFHRDSIGLDVHVPHTFLYADAAARGAAISADFTDPDDLFKLARQTSDQTYWVLEQITPSVVWNQLGGGGGAADLPFTTATDPAIDAAVTTAIIDLNSGTVITLTAAGNSQTLQAPTDTTPRREFFVLNNNTSNNTIPVNGITLAVGQYAEFRWDGTAWLLTAGGAAAGPGGLDTQIQFNDSGVLGGDPNNTWNKTTKVQTILGSLTQAGGDPSNLYTPTIVSTTSVGANPRYSDALGSFACIVDSNANDFRIFNITNKANPIQTNPTPLVIGTLRGVGIATNDLAFVCDTGSGGRLVAVDMSDKSAPVIRSTLVVGGSPRKPLVIGSTVFISNVNAAFGFQAVDISDLDNMKLLQSFTFGFQPRTEFVVRGNLLFGLANNSTSNFFIIDVSDPSNMVLKSTRDVGTGSNAPQAIAVQLPYAFVANEDQDGIDAFDVSDPTSTAGSVGFVALGGANSPRALTVGAGFLNVVDASTNAFQVVDVSDPTNMVLISTQLVLAGANPVAMTTIGRFSVVLDNTGDQFFIIDSFGLNVQAALIAFLEAGLLSVLGDAKVGGSMVVGTGLTVGLRGILTEGVAVAEGRRLGGASENVVEVFQESDFPDVGGLIKPAPGVTYMVMRPLTITKKIAHPTTVSGFDPSVIRTDAKYANIVTVNVASGSFLETSSGSGQLVLQNIRFESDGVVPFAIVSGSSQTALLTELDDCDVVGFAVGSLFTTCAFNINNASFWTGSGTFKLVDCECNVIGAFHANFTDTAIPALRVQSSAPGAPTKSFLTARNSKLSSQANEAFFMLHSNLVAGSTIRLTGVEASPFTPGTGAFFDTETGSVSALADSAGAPGVRTLVTSNGHTIADGDTVTMAGFTSATQMNATFVASNIVANQYEVVATFTTTDTGTWSNPSLTENSALVSSFDNPGQEESRAIGSMYVSNNVDVTVIATISTFTDLDLGTALAASNISAWTLTDAVTGELTYQGNEPFSGTVFASVSAFGAGGTSEYRFRAVKNGTVLPDAVETVIDVGSAAATASLVVPVSVANSDTVRLQVENVDNTSNITVTHASVSVQ